MPLGAKGRISGLESEICKSECIGQLNVQRNLEADVLRMFDKAYLLQSACVGAAVEPRLVHNAEGWLEDSRPNNLSLVSRTTAAFGEQDNGYCGLA